MAPKIASGVLCCGPSFMASAAFILSIFANSRCNLLKIDNTDLPIGATSFGLWCVTATDGTFYSTSDLTGDSKFEAARALGTTTLALGFCVWLFYLFAACCRFGPLTFRIIGFFCFCCATFQGLVFLVFKANVCSMWCGLDTGGNCAIAAIVLWFVASLMSCAAGKPPEDDEAGEEEQPKDDEEE